MKATVIAHSKFTISEIDPRLYGSFIEHLGRAVYTGIYEPDHPTADGDGMRQDVIDLVKELQVPIVRYPGGNFVSAYNWEDGIGPREERPVRLDLAWHTSESNQVGIHEFADWCETVGTEMMLAVNLGSRGLDEARNFLEYVNHEGGSTWSDKRRANGREAPFDVRLWCLGNEMDGPWQIGHKTADEYGRLAHETAKAMRAFDSRLELVVCGSSNAHMPTYPQWEATVLEHTYNEVDHISLHMYFENRANDTASYLARSLELDTYIGTVAGVIAYVKSKKRSKKDVYISFDEWNVWYHSKERDKAILEGHNGWPEAPPLLEDDYNFEDVLQVGCILNTFINRADVVKIACLAQLVNVIAPIMTVPGGPAWRQTIFYPYYYASVYGRGTALKLMVDSPSYTVEDIGKVPYLDVSAVHDATSGHVTFFLVNRHLSEALDLDVGLLEFGALSIVEDQVIAHSDLGITNTAETPDNVVPVKGEGALFADGRLTASIAPLSYRMIRLKA
ncbi:alpha-N-arabinofuranosidase [Rhizobium sp. PP-F2F-G36]|nr:alpha-N-arabinofuranosidase [Rhizobium sp. PP-F2F-G36]